MVTDDLEKRAEEFVDGIEDARHPATTFFASAIEDAWLAGYRACQQDTRPRKIDPGDEGTWPSIADVVMLFDGDQWWYGRNDTVHAKDGPTFSIFYGDNQRRDIQPTHWLPLPEIKEG